MTKAAAFVVAPAFVKGGYARRNNNCGHIYRVVAISPHGAVTLEWLGSLRTGPARQPSISTLPLGWGAGTTGWYSPCTPGPNAPAWALNNYNVKETA
jgi:hypothetical protein